MQILFYGAIMYLLYFGLSIGYVTYEGKLTKTQESRSKGSFWFIIIALFILRIAIAPSSVGHATDTNCFTQWSNKLAAEGMRNFYYPADYFADYPPLYMMVLWLFGHIVSIFSISVQSPLYTIIYRLPAMVCDILLAVVIVNFCKEFTNSRKLNSIALLFLLCPVIVINSTFWGQIDSVFTLFVLLSLIALYKDKFLKCALFFVIASLIKPQSFIFAPVFIAGFIVKKVPWKTWLKAVGIAVLLTFIVALPFSQNFDFSWLASKYFNTLNSYQYASVNAFNLYSMIGLNWEPLDSRFLFLSVGMWTKIVIVGGSILTFIFVYKSKKKSALFFGSYLIVTLLFTFAGKMHERYLYPAIVMLIICYLIENDKRLLYLFIGQSIVNFINTAYVLVNDVGDKGLTQVNTPFVVIFSIVQIVATIYGLYLLYSIYYENKKVKIPIKTLDTAEKPHFGKMQKRDYIIMLSITAIYAIVTFTNLGSFAAPQTFYNFSNTNMVMVDLGKEVKVGEISMYLGIGDSESFDTVDVSFDGENYENLILRNHDTVFQWVRNPLGDGITARYFKIYTSKPDQYIGEILFTDMDKKPITATATAGGEVLFDEQSTMPEQIGYKSGTYFDEVYHPRTAFEIINKLPVYETTHPPLGKVIMSLGILIFGMVPFGWRFMGALMGVLMLPMMYLLGKKIFGGYKWATVATLLFAFDFMHFSQTRLATIDSYAVLFIMISFYFMLDYYTKGMKNSSYKPLLWCGIFFGIASACKWIGLYSALGLGILLIITWVRGYKESLLDKKNWYKSKLWKTIGMCAVFFVVIPCIIYGASYIPQMRYDLDGRTPTEYVVENQEHMLTYHEGVTDDHPYGSKWYTWPVVGRPLWAYHGTEVANPANISSIVVFGNPLIWWAGLVAIFVMIYLGKKRKSYIATALLIGYLAQYLPWIFIGRVAFIYHYFASVPFLILILVYVIKVLYEEGRIKKHHIYGFMGTCAVLFIMFYPVLSGSEANLWYVKNVLTWFKSWVLTSA